MGSGKNEAVIPSSSTSVLGRQSSVLTKGALSPQARQMQGQATGDKYCVACCAGPKAEKGTKGQAGGPALLLGRVPWSELPHHMGQAEMGSAQSGYRDRCGLSACILNVSLNGARVQ